jgi:hypothetical protein
VRTDQILRMVFVIIKKYGVVGWSARRTWLLQGAMTISAHMLMHVTPQQLFLSPPFVCNAKPLSGAERKT